MYNKFLEYLLQNEPEKVLSYPGYLFRRSISPILRRIAPLTCGSKLKIVRRKPLPKGRQLIFAPTHGFRDDIAFSLTVAGTHAYMLFGSLPQFYNTFDGISAWLNGVVLVDRSNKESRRASMPKMEHYMGYGGNLLIFPEGVWNKSPNLLMLKLFPGIYRIAKKSNALIVPIATLYDEKANISYAIMEDAIDICKYDEQEGLEVLRDTLATLKWELMESYAQDTRDNVLQRKTPQQYWDDYINFLISQADYYDYKVENSAEFIDKRVTTSAEAFAHLDRLIPCRENAFLLRKKNMY